MQGGLLDGTNFNFGDAVRQGILAGDIMDEAMGGGDEEVVEDPIQQDADNIDDDTWFASMVLKWKTRGKFGDRELK